MQLCLGQKSNRRNLLSTMFVQLLIGNTILSLLSARGALNVSHFWWAIIEIFENKHIVITVEFGRLEKRQRDEILRDGVKMFHSILCLHKN